jgi:hypothetical protein
VGALLASGAVLRDGTPQLAFLGFAAVVFIAVVALEFDAAPHREASFYLALPVIISATQNVYVGVITPYISSTQVQILVVLNFIFGALLCLAGYVTRPRGVAENLTQATVWILVLLMGYAGLTAVAFHSAPMSAFASLRNVVNPPLFFLLGLVLAHRTVLGRFLRYIAYLAGALFIFGVYERYVNQNIWSTLHLGELWTKKGIPISTALDLPYNFYSSETIHGEQLRRMVSSFADPVNYGTFLFFGYMTAWYLRRYLLGILMIMATVLTISKGAMLGLLVFGVLWAKVNTSRTVFVATSVAAGAAGAAFIAYSLTHSTASTLTHLTGFTDAFKQLPSHPLGHGLGNVGVLAGLYSTGASTGITESGIGMIIGQLGVIGLGLYLAFFRLIYMATKAIPEPRTKLLAMSLLIGIILNSAFNEVALSPNSSAVYFMALGLLSAQALADASFAHDDQPSISVSARHKMRSQLTRA